MARQSSRGSGRKWHIASQIGQLLVSSRVGLASHDSGMIPLRISAVDLQWNGHFVRERNSSAVRTTSRCTLRNYFYNVMVDSIHPEQNYEHKIGTWGLCVLDLGLWVFIDDDDFGMTGFYTGNEVDIHSSHACIEMPHCKLSLAHKRLTTWLISPGRSLQKTWSFRDWQRVLKKVNSAVPAPTNVHLHC